MSARCADCGACLRCGAAALSHVPLEGEPELCSRCPTSPAERAAQRAGVLAGTRAGSGELAQHDVATWKRLTVPPYPVGELRAAERAAWLRGWWAGWRCAEPGLAVARRELLGVLAARVASEVREADVVLWFCACGHIGGVSTLRPSSSTALVCPGCGASGDLASDGGDPERRARLRMMQARLRRGAQVGGAA